MYSEWCGLDRRDKFKNNCRKILFFTEKSVALIKETNTIVTVERSSFCTVKGVALIVEKIQEYQSKDPLFVQ